MNILTPREKEIIILIADGHQTAKIAELLCRDRATIKNHKTNMCKKLGFEHTTELYKYAILNATMLQNGGG